MPIPRQIDRSKVNEIWFSLRWSTGLRTALEQVCRDNETLASVVREAVEREIRRRSRSKRFRGAESPPGP
jgi:hypothetical protein